MGNLKEVRTRIASVSSTQQITSAMKMVSAAKFRRAQNAIVAMRPYDKKLSEIIRDINVEDGVSTPYHEVREAKKVLLVVVTSNKGLCGAFNSNVIKEANQRIQHYQAQNGVELTLITIGKRATEHFGKHTQLVKGSFDELLDKPAFDDVAKIAEDIMNKFCAKEYDKVEIVYNKFKNSLTQILTTEQFLPVMPDEAKKAENKVQSDYIFEPSKEEILREMIPLSLRSQFFRVILDSLASEHGARMTAMQKATDNATELLKELKLTYNKARQSAITNEIIEIVSGAEALNG
ncbi:MAG: ATP synthase F1 subunit gamma [Bacteroidales bacterium]|nr:ATP synthase F1 subunit gamma [Bacteroidales bacterium]MBR5029405.1 ATP synthase F1 subunit gamma [Bacteroidales bacterium]